jgi:hypothetical protein
LKRDAKLSEVDTIVTDLISTKTYALSYTDTIKSAYVYEWYWRTDDGEMRSKLVALTNDPDRSDFEYPNTVATVDEQAARKKTAEVVATAEACWSSRLRFPVLPTRGGIVDIVAMLKNSPPFVQREQERKAAISQLGVINNTIFLIAAMTEGGSQ